jgi:hypothetical protein
MIMAWRKELFLVPSGFLYELFSLWAGKGMASCANPRIGAYINSEVIISTKYPEPKWGQTKKTKLDVNLKYGYQM